MQTTIAETALDRCLKAIGESAARHGSQMQTLTEYSTSLRKFDTEMLDSRAQAIREGKWFYGYRYDRETYPQYQVRALKEIGRTA